MAAAFLVELLQDRERGAVRSVAEYQARYPGFEHVIAREFEELRADGDESAVDPSARSPFDEEAGPRYRIEDEVGRGGMGTVYRAFEKRFRRSLALKKSRAGAGPAELARFVEEARVTAQLHHPGIVPVHDFGVDADGQLFFTMDLVRGRTFAEILREGRDGDPRWQRHLDVLQRVCEAVAFAHSKDVVHRDLKPANVMVGRFGEVYVMDWGLARVAGRADPATERAAEDSADGSLVLSTRSDDTPAWTMQGDVVGTPAYMAPEQARGAAIDARSDVYAIGAMLYERICGRMPFGGEVEQPSSRLILERLVDGPPKSLTELCPDAPAELVAICDKAMQRDPSLRYQDVLAMRDDLRAFVEQRVVQAYESGYLAELRKWLRRNRLLAAAVVLAMMSLAIGLVVSLAQTDRAEQAASNSTDSLHDAVAAIERMLTNVGNTVLDGVPKAAPVRKQLLADATSLFEQLLVRDPHDAEVRRRAAEAYHIIADLHGRMGDRSAQAAASQRALELRQALLREFPEDRELQFDLAGTFNALGLAALAVGDEANASSHYREALSVCESMLARKRDAVALYLAATLWQNLGVIDYQQRRSETATEYIENALDLHEEILTSGCDDYRAAYAWAHNVHGGVLRLKKDLAGAKAAWQAACDLYARLYEEDPDAGQLRHQYAQALSNLSVGHYELKDRENAVATIARVVEIRRKYAEDHPDFVESWVSLTSTLNNKAQYQRSMKDLAGAAATSSEGLQAIRRALALDPAAKATAKAAFLAHRNWHRASVHLGRHAALARNARELAALAGAERNHLRNAAHWLVDAAWSVKDDQALREAYVVEALQLLERVHERGELLPTDLDHQKLRRLRSRPDFQDLRRRAEKGK